jgi:uncharacterized protein (TIGR02300 family)
MPDLGTKYECTSCSTKFYDLGKPEPICPKCGLNQLAEEEEEPAAVEEETEEATEKEAPGKTDKKDAEEAPTEEEGGDEKPDK